MTKIRGVPKKLREVFALLRKGKLETGLTRLDDIEGMDDFAAHMVIARAEIAYFEHDFERAMMLDETGLPFHDQWYAGNVVDEHFVAYVRAATAIRKQDRAREFLKAFLEREKGRRVPASDRPRHTFHLERYGEVIRDLLGRLDGKKKGVPSYAESSAPKPMSAFVEQLKKYRPKVSPASVEAADYMLHFVYEHGRAADFISLYEKFGGRITTMDHHVHAAKVFVAKKKTASAVKAIRTMTTKAWYYVEAMQVAPMQLWAHDDLAPVLTAKLCRELLELPKGQT
jgi:hypothetical protein